ncbi:hypothetical protein PS865_04422 [Pseudomonas fluorescens]|uniref:hypothetical protein n=1 Tax=Pseudomonas fluorescens TaxID=294 RepID=UPI001242AB8C|nr:hypothetical protein [Pseudomonas fluorescens]VVP32243.1 hypothetical protein PS865_04422 [Pseudomonas fluorescens]
MYGIGHGWSKQYFDHRALKKAFTSPRQLSAQTERAKLKISKLLAKAEARLALEHKYQKEAVSSYEPRALLVYRKFQSSRNMRRIQAENLKVLIGEDSCKAIGLSDLIFKYQDKPG